MMRIEFPGFINYLLDTIAGNKNRIFKLNILIDNYFMDKNYDVLLASHANVFFFDTPASGGWLSLAELFFKFNRHPLKGTSFSSVDEIDQAIDKFMDYHNRTPNPFRWLKSEVKGTSSGINFLKFIG
jgi:hypothetical protein